MIGRHRTGGSDRVGRPTPQPPTALRGWGPFLELFALSGLAIAQPAFDVLGKNAELFVTRRATGLQTITLAVIAILLPPALAFGLERLIGLAGARPRRYAHMGLCGLFVGLIVLEVAKHATPLTTSRTWFLAVLGGVAGAWIVRSAYVRQFLHLLAVAPLLFALQFVAFSPVADVVRASPPAVATVEPRTPHPVVLIVMDEFPEMSLLDGTGHVDAALFPTFAALAGGATWYRNETTVSGFTQEAVPAILTGRFPSGTSKLPTAENFPKSLFTMFGTPKDLNVHEVLTHLCPADRCSTEANGTDDLISDAWKLWTDFAIPGKAAIFNQDVDQAHVSVQTAHAFARSLRRPRPAAINFVHIEAPHLPWHRIGTLQSYDVPLEPVGENIVFMPPGPGAKSSQQRHLLQVQASDTLLRNILTALRAHGAYDDALIIVTADHGIGFTPDEPTRSPSAGNLTGVAFPPLFVKYPGQHEGRVDDRPASSIDILPTIADVVGARPGWHFDGRSLRGAPRTTADDRRLYIGRDANAPKTLVVPHGAPWVTLHGSTLFPQVLRAQAAPAGPDPSLRIYERVPYGGLLGRKPTELGVDPAGTQTLSLPNLDALRRADRSSSTLPWLWNEGTVEHTDAAVWIAVAVDGRIVAATPTLTPADGQAPVTFLVPPSLVHGRRHTVAAFLVSGPTSGVRLQRLPIRAG